MIRVTLRDWETNRFIGRLASACKISRNRIFSSGLKDKRAVTTQLMVVDAKSKVIEEIEIPDTEIEILGRTHQKVGMGNHDGNRFTITQSEDVWMRMVIHLKAKRQCQEYYQSENR